MNVPSNESSRKVMSAVSSAEQQRNVYRNIDILAIPLIVLLFAGIFSFHFALTVGDWDYWVDWRDRRWWPLITPLSLLVLPAVFGYLLWTRLRLPLAASVALLSFALAAWVSRVMNFEMFAGFPLNMVSPSTFIWNDFDFIATSSKLPRICSTCSGARFGMQRPCGMTCGGM